MTDKTTHLLARVLASAYPKHGRKIIICLLECELHCPYIQFHVYLRNKIKYGDGSYGMLCRVVW
jgi:hypothetical protein